MENACEWCECEPQVGTLCTQLDGGAGAARRMLERTRARARASVMALLSTPEEEDAENDEAADEEEAMERMLAGQRAKAKAGKSKVAPKQKARR